MTNAYHQVVLCLDNALYGQESTPGLHCAYLFEFPIYPNTQLHIKGRISQIQSTLVISTSVISYNRLSRSENLDLLKHKNLTIGKKYCGKEEKLLLRSNFSSFPQYFQYISNFKSPITYIDFLNMVVRFIFYYFFFLNSANLICRGTDISKYFRGSLGIRDNESRLYVLFFLHKKIYVMGTH